LVFTCTQQEEEGKNEASTIWAIAHLDVACVAEHDYRERAHGSGLHQLHAPIPIVAPSWAEALLEECQIPTKFMKCERYDVDVKALKHEYVSNHM